MGFVNQSLAQMRDLFLSMTPAARITAALLLGVIAVSLGYLFQGYAGGADEPLFGGEFLQPQDVARIETAFAEAGLVILPQQAGRVMVPRGEKTAYLAAIADAGALPANFDTLLDDSLDGGLLESGEKGKQRFKAARERQLSMMVSMMDGVEDAKVLYDIREPKGFERQKVTATVSVRPAAGTTLDPQRMRNIRDAVAGAVAGLDPKSVTILNQQDGSQQGGGGGGEVVAASFDEPYFQVRANFEQLMKSKVEDVLHYIPGVRVQVSAELDPTLSAELSTIKADGESTAIQESSTKDDSRNTQVDDRGPPGLTINGPNGPSPEQAVAKNENSTTSDKRDTVNFVPTTTESRQTAGLEPQRVRASIAVPSDYILRVWRESVPEADRKKPPDRSQLTQIETTEKGNIQRAVANLFPKEVGKDPYPNVEVTVFQSLTPDPVEPPSMVSEGLLWASSNSGSLIMAGLALVSMVMLRSMVKSIPASEPGLAFARPTLAAETAARAEPSTATGGAKPQAAGGASGAGSKDKSRPRLRLKKGPTLKDDLSEMVREDPDGAAAILRTWIGNAG